MIGALVTVLVFPVIGAAVQRFTGGGARFLLGVGTTGFLLYITFLLHIPPLPVLVVMIVASIAVLVTVRRREMKERVERSTAATIVTVAPVVFLLFAAAVVPLRDYDGRAFWVLKAKAIATERQIDGPFFQSERSHNPKNEYPLLVPLAAGAVMMAARDIDDSHVRWLYVLALGSLALHARRWVGAWPAALMAWIPQFAVAGEGGALSAYNDIFVAAFAACAFFELIERTSPARFGLWISFLVLTKNEGLPFALILTTLAVIVWRQRAVSALPSFAAALLTLFVWRSRVEPTDDDPLIRLLGTLPGQLDRFAPAVRGFVGYAFDFERWGFFWIAVLVAAAVLMARREWRTLALPVTIVLLMTAVYISAYMVTNWPMDDHIKVSASRLQMHFIGPALYLIGAMVHRK